MTLYFSGFWCRAFPVLFPRNIDREGEDGTGYSGYEHRRETGDITEPRIGKTPSLGEWLKHLIRLRRAFSNHYCFVFVATNVYRRRLALARGKVFAHNCAQDLTLTQLKTAMEDGDNRVFKKILHFASPIPGTAQYWRFQSDQSLSLLRWLRISSDDKEMFNCFLTFSAADLHWPDLHKILPGSEAYLTKCPTRDVTAKDPQQQHLFIDSTEDIKMRQKAIKENEDLVVWWFKQRVDTLLSEVLPKMGMKEYIVRYEAQQRGEDKNLIIFLFS